MGVDSGRSTGTRRVIGARIPPRRLSPMPRRLRPIRAWRLPESAPAPIGQAAALEASLDQELLRAPGALPVFLPIMEHLRLPDLDNRHVAPNAETHTHPH